MVINHNLNAMNAHRNMNSSTISQGKSMEKLSSGLRINRACDDAAGLAISERMRSQIRGLNQASKNAQDGISMIQTAEGALIESQAIAQRMREISVQSANGIYTDDDRKLINQEFDLLKSEIDRIADETEFNGMILLDGSLSGKVFRSDAFAQGGGVGTSNLVKKFSVKPEELAKLGEGEFEFKVNVANFGPDATVTVQLIDKLESDDAEDYIIDTVELKGVDTTTVGKEKFIIGDMEVELSRSGLFTGVAEFENKSEKIKDGVTLQVGANEKQNVGFGIDSMKSRLLGLGGVGVGTAKDAQRAIQFVDRAISKISEQRANLGASQNRLEYAIISTENTAENLQASESRIRDVDMAKEMMNLTKLNVLQQASQAMLAQANQAPQNVLSILK